MVHWLPYGDLRTSVIDEALAGKKKICVAISEALAGSDVAGIQTTAAKRSRRQPLYRIGHKEMDYEWHIYRLFHH